MIGPNVESTPPDLAEKFWENVQEAARQEDSTSGTKVRTARISGSFKPNSRVDIKRDYADTPDGMEYAVIAGGMKPKPGDPVVFLDGEGGPVVLGKMWRPGDPDLVDVNGKAINAQSDATRGIDKADTARIRADNAQGDANTGINKADNARVRADDAMFRANNHSHGSHWHNQSSIGNHNHATSYYWGSTDAQGYVKGPLRWYSNDATSGGGGGHNHGGTDNATVN